MGKYKKEHFWGTILFKNIFWGNVKKNIFGGTILFKNFWGETVLWGKQHFSRTFLTAAENKHAPFKITKTDATEHGNECLYSINDIL